VRDRPEHQRPSSETKPSCVAAVDKAVASKSAVNSNGNGRSIRNDFCVAGREGGMTVLALFRAAP
jgi:hypothetical protein